MSCFDIGVLDYDSTLQSTTDNMFLDILIYNGRYTIPSIKIKGVPYA